jgi:FAD binding domain-containing protein
MHKLEVHNWLGDIVSSPSVVIEPENVQEIIAIIQDPEKYPAPVRPVGSNHSTTQCGVADSGTLVVMRKMKRILNIGSDTVTVEAGALYIDVGKELQKRNLQFYVNAEIGTLTVGSAASCNTKKSCMAGEYGEMCTYAIAMKMVTPAGERIEVTEQQPDLLQVMRSSYGLLGIIYEVTFRIRPLLSMTTYHKTYSIEQFQMQLPALIATGEAMMMFVGVFTNTVTVEFRRYREDEDPRKASSWQWRLRNLIWKTLAPYTSYFMTRYVPLKGLRYFILDVFNRLGALVAVLLIHGKNTLAPDQMIHFDGSPGHHRLTFSIWGFPVEDYPRIQRGYIAFCHEYYRSKGYRCNLLDLAYLVSQDTSSLLSYSPGGAVITIDPVSTGDAGWDEFLVAYNDFCSANGGVPLFNQTKMLTRAQVEKAFGERLQTFETYRVRFDPTGRMLNDYFRQLFNL